jgi:hypothetical protein
MVQFLKPIVKDSELTKSLSEASNRFIQQVQKELPKGVEITKTTALEGQEARVA